MTIALLIGTLASLGACIFFFLYTKREMKKSDNIHKQSMLWNNTLISGLLAFAGVITMIYLYFTMHGTFGLYGDNVKWTYYDGVLTIYGQGPMADAENGNYPQWRKWSDRIEEVVIEEGVTSIGKYVFCGCRQLREVKLPKTLREIKRDAFRETGLEELEIPSGVGVIGVLAFQDCTSLKSITFLGMAPNWESDKEDRACDCFVGVTATVYYPRWNETWYDYNARDLGGDLTFVPYSRS